MTTKNRHKWSHSSMSHRLWGIDNNLSPIWGEKNLPIGHRIELFALCQAIRFLDQDNLALNDVLRIRLSLISIFQFPYSRFLQTNRTYLLGLHQQNRHLKIFLENYLRGPRTGWFKVRPIERRIPVLEMIWGSYFWFFANNHHQELNRIFGQPNKPRTLLAFLHRGSKYNLNF